MRLTFTPQAHTAAHHLITNTSLGNLPETALAWSYRKPGGLIVSDDWSFSSGESVLIAALQSFTNDGYGFDPASLTLLDERTASVVVEAIAMRAGIELTVAGKHKRVAS
jgi:hypothetical protein